MVRPKPVPPGLVVKNGVKRLCNCSGGMPWPGVLPARDVLWMATRAGAQTLGLDAEIGSLEVGKRADVIVVDRDGPHVWSDGSCRPGLHQHDRPDRRIRRALPVRPRPNQDG